METMTLPETHPDYTVPDYTLPTRAAANRDRKPVYSPRGMVATSQPLAASAGLAVLRRGGNAVDAALATAITLTVTQPNSNGVGGDLFALVWDGAELHGLNGSGRAPLALTAAGVRGQGHTLMPDRGWLPVTVPGAPRAWRDLHDRFGSLPFGVLFEDAISYAEDGFPVSPTAAWHWRLAVDRIHPALTGPEHQGFLPMFAPAGRAPRPGELWRSAELAGTFRRLAATGADDFYTGETARRITGFAARTGGSLAAPDLAAHVSTWVEPLGVRYRGYDVWELPPNGQGLAALLALAILDGVKLPDQHSAERYHLQIEAMKLAFADAHRYIADPDRTDVPVAGLLSPEYVRRRRELITDRALEPEPGQPARGGTVYLCTADSAGMMVSLIQSNFNGFGSHVVVPGTGVSLHDRGAAFSLDEGQPNRLEPGKRPFHTIIPGFLTREGRAAGPFGVMGAHMQPQGHLQLISNTVDAGMDPQAALDEPRWHWSQGRQVYAEPGIAAGVRGELAGRGHQVSAEGGPDLFGCGQAIWRLPGGGYVAGTEPRTDGCALGY
jgi:gamma-glutamyltranspeptidase/glutathione hydrolase